ncbi:hypothetical protein D3C71_1071570 [compost metagenome]
MVDVENRNLIEAGLKDQAKRLLVDFVAGFEIDFTRLVVDDVFGQEVAVEVFVSRLKRLQALVDELADKARGQLLATFDNNFAGVGVDHVGDDLGILQRVRLERDTPAVAGALVGSLGIEGRQDFFAVHAERHQERGHGQLAATVDTRIDDVLGVEFDVEPGTAIRDNAGSEKQLAGRMALALVVIEEHARRTVHLRNDDALGAVDDERTVIGHERHVAHVDRLFLDVLDGLRARILVNIEYDEAQRHLQGSCVGQVALTAFLDVELRRVEFVGNELEHRSAGEIRDREDGLEDRIQAFVRTAALGLFYHQELVIGCLLNLDEVRHFRDFGDLTKKLAYAPATIKRKGLLSHRRSFKIASGPATDGYRRPTDIPSNMVSQSRPACRNPKPDCLALRWGPSS